MSLESVIKNIEANTSYRFLYRTEQIDMKQRVYLSTEKTPVIEVLNDLSRSNNFNYKIFDHNLIVLSPNKAAPKYKVKGTVISAKTLETLIGVSIKEKGTSNATITDINGAFSISVSSPNAILEISYIGYEKQEVEVNNNSLLTIKLVEFMKTLDEVVVVGYGTQKKETVTGSIASVKTQDLVQTPVSNISNALVGRISGLSALQSSGEPGDNAATIMIRGVGTLNTSGQSPLVIIDGVESSFSILNAIDANEIENISVLKDASATAVYGVRGANGVIILTTRRGVAGKPKISFTSNIGLTQLTSNLKMLDSYHYALYRNEAILTDNDPSYFSSLFTNDELWKFQHDRDYTPAEVEAMNLSPDKKAALLKSPALYYGSHDYFKEQYGGTAPQQQYNLNVSGGTEKVRYFTSLGYFSQEGEFNNANYGAANINSYYKRYNFRSNYDVDVIKNLKVTADVSGQFATNGGVLGNAQDGNITQSYSRHKAMMVAILDGPPYVGPGIIDGKLVNAYISNTNPLQAKGGGGFSPITNFLSRPYLTTYNTNLNANIKITHNLEYLTKGLSLTGTVSYNDTYVKGVYRSQPVPEYTVTRNPSDPSQLLFYGGSIGASYVQDNYNDYKQRREYFELASNYNRTFGKHAVTGLVLMNAQKRFDPSLSYNVPSGLMGMAARTTYSYDQRYLAEVDMGYNGSENFPVNKRFGLFPAYSAGWIVSNEHLFPKNDIVTWLKLRGSYGEVGNDQIGGSRFLYLPSTWGYGGNWIYGGYSYGNSNGGSLDPFYAGAYESTVGNPAVTWERAKKTNIGLEINFFKNRLSFVGDIFKEKRDNILWNLGTIPATVGASLPPANIGKVTNHGYELQLGWTDKIGKIDYSIKANVSYANNKIDYMDEPAYPYAWMNQTGFCLGQFKGLHSEGFYNTNDEAVNRPYSSTDGNKVQPGDIRYVDINGDGKIDAQDKVPIEYSNVPRYAFNSTLSIGYKGFSVSMLFIGSAQGSMPLTSFYITNPFYMTSGAAEQFQYDGRWTPEKVAQGITPTFPRASIRTYSTQDGVFSDFWLKSNDFVRLKNIEVSYQFSNVNFLKRAGINGLRVFFNGNNIYTWTKLMDGIDPEQLNAGGASDGYLYPMTRIYNFGVNIQF
ncbi:MAG: TonB-dependent receptor [Bacteroidota bacterium]|nr:TonB-dependent receptor [Bacteroidota bacterium]